ncbi:MAG: hypothetical protein SFT92_01950 [Rickettsiales bacterium]|nr:hypothetical protein [Rickettsiales bacterium]
MDQEQKAPSAADKPTGRCPFARLAGKGQQFSELGHALNLLVNLEDDIDFGATGSKYQAARSFTRFNRPYELATGVAEVMQVIHSELRRTATNVAKLIDEDRMGERQKKAFIEFRESIADYSKFMRPYAERLRVARPNEDLSEELFDNIFQMLPRGEDDQFREQYRRHNKRCEEAANELMEACERAKAVPLKLLRRNAKSRSEPIYINIKNDKEGLLAKRFCFLAVTQGSIDEANVPDSVSDEFIALFDSGANGITKQPLPEMYDAVNRALRKRRLSDEERKEVRKASGLEPNPELIHRAVDKHRDMLATCAYAAAIYKYGNADARGSYSTSLAALKDGLGIDLAAQMCTTKELAVVGSALLNAVDIENSLPLREQIERWEKEPEQYLSDITIPTAVIKNIQACVNKLPAALQKPLEDLAPPVRWRDRIAGIGILFTGRPGVSNER